MMMMILSWGRCLDLILVAADSDDEIAEWLAVKGERS